MSPAVQSIILPRAFGRYALFDLIGRGGMAEIYLAQPEDAARRVAALRRKADSACARGRSPVQRNARPRGEARGTPEPRECRSGIRSRPRGGPLVHRDGVRRGLRHERTCFVAVRAPKCRCPSNSPFTSSREALRGPRLRAPPSGRRGPLARDRAPRRVAIEPLISFDGEVKVCDFGIARANDAIADSRGASPRTSSSEAIKGKAGYMSPEHARGEPMDARADVFAAGIVLWELLAGRRMYKSGDGAPSLLDQARRADIPPLPPLGLPEEDALRAVVAKALAVDRNTRYGSAPAMLRESRRLRSAREAANERAAARRVALDLLRCGDHFAKAWPRACAVRARAGCAALRGADRARAARGFTSRRQAG